MVPCFSNKKAIRILCLLLTLILALPLFVSCKIEYSEEDQIKNAIESMWKETKGSSLPSPTVQSTAALRDGFYDFLVLCSDSDKPVLILVNTTDGVAKALPTKLYVWSMLEGLYQDNTNPNVLVQFFANCYNEYGEDAFNNVLGTGYGKVVEGLCKIGSIKKSREYVVSSLINETGADVVVLFKERSPELSCVVTTTQSERYNWTSVPENIARYYYNTDRSTYYALELNLGPAYSLVTQYVAHPIYIDPDTEELELSDDEEVFDSMASLKKALEAEEM